MTDKTILFVEDSEFDRKLVVGAISEKLRCRTLEAANGEQGLAILQNQKVDLVIMDIMMPGYSGTDVLKKIRKKFNAINLPIIMLTAKSDTADVTECLRNGANDYITKPVNFEVAISRITTHLNLSELSKEMSKLKEITALDAVITTYNHEINNPLSIAIGCLDSIERGGALDHGRLKTSLWRIAAIVKKIREVSEKKEVEYQEYASTSKMIKVK